MMSDSAASDDVPDPNDSVLYDLTTEKIWESEKDIVC